ncbi:MAG: ABC transporter permease [Bdellovibrionales bacterium]
MGVIASKIWEPVDNIGRKVLQIIEYTKQVLLMVYLSIRAAIFDQAQGMRDIIRVVSMQIYFTGFQAMALITTLALATGSIVIMQSSAQLSILGGSDMIGKLMLIIIVREVGPLLTALIVIARSGTAVASELGNMRVNKEVTALESMGINPLSYIVFPRLVGGIISVLCLAFYFSVIALIGGFFVSRLTHDMSFAYYTASLASAFEVNDVYMFLLKNTFSGMIIFVVCCYQGFQVEKSPHEVPQATTKAVVNSIIYVVGFNLLVTTLFYLKNLMDLGVL